jgi:hypothetical protein
MEVSSSSNYRLMESASGNILWQTASARWVGVTSVWFVGTILFTYGTCLHQVIEVNAFVHLPGPSPDRPPPSPFLLDTDSLYLFFDYSGPLRGLASLVGPMELHQPQLGRVSRELHVSLRCWLRVRHDCGLPLHALCRQHSRCPHARHQ